jgi:hypothetical protein
MSSATYRAAAVSPDHHALAVFKLTSASNSIDGAWKWRRSPDGAHSTLNETTAGRNGPPVIASAAWEERLPQGRLALQLEPS